MTAHTPGLWREFWIRPDLAQGHTFDPTCVILAESEYGTIRLADIPDPLTPQEEANARLVASAPDLLQACRDALASLEDYNTGDDCDMWSPGQHPQITALQAVIAKATGTTPD